MIERGRPGKADHRLCCMSWCKKAIESVQMKLQAQPLSTISLTLANENCAFLLITQEREFRLALVGNGYFPGSNKSFAASQSSVED